LVLLSKSSKGDGLDGTIVTINRFCCCVHKTDYAVLQLGRINDLVVITGLDNNFSLALEERMLHFLNCLNHQLEKFLLIMFEGGLSSRGTIAEDRNFGNLFIVLIRNFFNASGSGVPGKKNFEKRLVGKSLVLWPRMEVSIKGAESGKVLVINPFLVARQGSWFHLLLDSTSLITIVFTSLSILACSMMLDINLAQNPWSTEIKLIF
jgi:hypothetical protein